MLGGPFDENAVVPPLDGVGDGEGHGGRIMVDGGTRVSVIPRVSVIARVSVIPSEARDLGSHWKTVRADPSSLRFSG